MRVQRQYKRVEGICRRVWRYMSTKTIQESRLGIILNE